MDFELLRKYDIPVLDYRVVSEASDALHAAQKIGYPIALKLISDDVLHKSEHHALSLNLKTPASIVSEFHRLRSITRGKSSKILVQKFSPAYLELIVGGKTDPQFGPMIMVGLGGIYTEILKDISISICPAQKEDIRDMILSLKSYPLLKGVRGQPGLNLAALEGLLSHMSRLMVCEMPKEIDINPLFATKQGLVAADVRVLR
jgi:acyl-CoA synthetase (NDP forming)